MTYKTVTMHETLLPPQEAVIVVLPRFFAVTIPALLTEATAVSPLDHVSAGAEPCPEYAAVA